MTWNIIFLILNSLGLLGMAVFIYFVYNGLRERINSLIELVQEQRETIEAVRVRALEMDKLSKSYKQALTDFQEMGSKLNERRNELIKELEEANKQKDEKLISMKKLQLEKLELKHKSLEETQELLLKAISGAFDSMLSQLGLEATKVEIREKKSGK